MHIDDISTNTSQPAQFYFDKNGNVVFTEAYLKDRGYCCGNGCRHCPYKPRHQKGNRKL